MYSSLKYIIFRLLFVFILYGSVYTASAGGKLLGIPYTLPGQKYTLMLVVASLPSKPQGHDLVLVGRSYKLGFGVYDYHFRLEEILKDKLPHLPVKRVMISSDGEVEPIEKIFKFPSRNEDIIIGMFVSEESNIAEFLYQRRPGSDESGDHIGQVFDWIDHSRLTVSLVNGFEFLKSCTDGIPFPYLHVETLTHHEGLDDREYIKADYEAMTSTVFAGSKMSYDISFESIGGEKYITDMLDAFDGTSMNGMFEDCVQASSLAPGFGVLESDIGFLINNPLDSDTLKKDIGYMDDVLQEVVFKDQSVDQFLASEYYVSYMHSLFSNLQFIQTIVYASGKKNFTVFSKLQAEDFENHLVIDALDIANVGVVEYWSEITGWKKTAIKGRRADNDFVTLKVINPYPLYHRVLRALTYFAQPVVGTTGELSLFRALSMGKLPLHEWMIAQRFLNRDLGNVAKESGELNISAFYTQHDPHEKSEALRSILGNPDSIKKFSAHLRTQYNASDFLSAMVGMIFHDESALWKSIEDVEKAIIQDNIASLPLPLQDIAWTRKTLNRVKMFYSPDYRKAYFGDDPESKTFSGQVEVLRSELKSYVQHIKMPLMHDKLAKSVAAFTIKLSDD